MPGFDGKLVREPVHRIIASRWPTVGVFDNLADNEAEMRQLFELEAFGNARLNIPLGRLARIPDGGIVTGPTAHLVMAAFVHCHDDGGRFNDGSLGAWYAALDVDTAIEETTYHLTRRLALSEGGFPQQMQMRQLVTKVIEPILDVSGHQTLHPELYALDDYSSSKAFANSVRWPFAGEQGAAGIFYDSVRKPGGLNVCVFKPAALERPVTQGDHYQYDWNRQGELYVDRLTSVKSP